MIVDQERAWFRSYAANTYTGTGAVVDLGCFVGSSTTALAEGLSATAKLPVPGCMPTTVLSGMIS
jgi:predicted O-methyltransferase YrrM